jgi:hypothetical protein
MAVFTDKLDWHVIRTPTRLTQAGRNGLPLGSPPAKIETGHAHLIIPSFAIRLISPCSRHRRWVAQRSPCSSGPARPGGARRHIVTRARDRTLHR